MGIESQLSKGCFMDCAQKAIEEYQLLFHPLQSFEIIIEIKTSACFFISHPLNMQIRLSVDVYRHTIRNVPNLIYWLFVYMQAHMCMRMCVCLFICVQGEKREGERGSGKKKRRGGGEEKTGEWKSKEGNKEEEERKGDLRGKEGQEKWKAGCSSSSLAA